MFKFILTVLSLWLLLARAQSTTDSSADGDNEDDTVNSIDNVDSNGGSSSDDSSYGSNNFKAELGQIQILTDGGLITSLTIFYPALMDQLTPLADAPTDIPAGSRVVAGMAEIGSFFLSSTSTSPSYSPFASRGGEKPYFRVSQTLYTPANADLASASDTTVAIGGDDASGSETNVLDTDFANADSLVTFVLPDPRPGADPLQRVSMFIEYTVNGSPVYTHKVVHLKKWQSSSSSSCSSSSSNKKFSKLQFQDPITVRNAAVVHRVNGGAGLIQCFVYRRRDGIVAEFPSNGQLQLDEPLVDIDGFWCMEEGEE